MPETDTRRRARKIADKLLVVGIAIALVAPFAYLYASQRDAPLICRSAADIELYPADEPEIIAAGLGDEDLEALDRFEALGSLQIQTGHFTDAGMVHVGRHTGLTRLILESDEVSDAGVNELRMLQALEELSLMGFQRVTAEGLDFVHVCGRMRTLVLYRLSQVDDSFGATLAKCTGLERLEIQNLRLITDAIVADIARLPKLRVLALDLCGRLTQNCIEPILGMAQLEELSLHGVDSLTDETMLRLASLKNLRKLQLPVRAELSSQAIEQLRREMPNCKIER
jgi:hypothetical protein